MSASLFVQMAALNEREGIGDVIRTVPRDIPGIGRVTVLVVDDGSTDGTSDIARQSGADMIIRHDITLGLGVAFQRGLVECLARGADIIVHTDADGQFLSSQIPNLIQPILTKRADIAIGRRPMGSLRHYTPVMRLTHLLGAGAMAAICGQRVHDPVCGFRAFSAHAAAHIQVTHAFSHTIETLAQVRPLGLHVDNVPVSARVVSRPSRLLRHGGLNFVVRQAAILLDMLVQPGWSLPVRPGLHALVQGRQPIRHPVTVLRE